MLQERGNGLTLREAIARKLNEKKAREKQACAKTKTNEKPANVNAEIDPTLITEGNELSDQIGNGEISTT